MRRLIWAVPDLSHDAFLGGRLRLWQPVAGYRAGVDAVMLAAAVSAQTGDSVLELGCGVGTASLCLASRVPGLAVTGIEVQPDYAALATRNAAENRLPLRVLNTDLRELPADIRNAQFTHVMMNPPYFDRDTGTAAKDNGRDTALGGATPLADWLNTGIKRLAPKGHLTLIMRMERLPEVMVAIGTRLGSLVLQPIAGRLMRPPELFLLRGTLAGRAPFHMASPLTMHKGATHSVDSESYTDTLHAVLRNGEKLIIAP